MEIVSLHGQQVAFDRQVGRGPTFLLLHGIGSSCQTWDLVWPRLADEGLDFVALDLPGHGRSGKERGDYSLGSLASTVRDLLDHLGVARAYVVGHSLGGGVAMQFAYQFPDRVDGLVLVASGGLGPETFPLLRAATLPGAELVLPLVTHPRTLAVGSRVGELVARVGVRPQGFTDALRTLAALDEPEARQAFLATLRGVVDVHGQRVSAVAKLAAVGEVPTTLVWGDRDPVIPLRHAEAAHELLAGSRLVVFPGSGHEPHRYDPVRFADLVRELSVSTHHAGR